MLITKDKAIRAVRARARELGMVYRVQNKKIAGVQAYELVNKATNELLRSDITVQSGYEDMENGVLEAVALAGGCESEQDREWRIMLERKDITAARMAACIKTIIREETRHAYGWHARIGLPCKESLIQMANVRLTKSHSINIIDNDFHNELFTEILDSVYAEQEQLLCS